MMVLLFILLLISINLASFNKRNLAIGIFLFTLALAIAWFFHHMALHALTIQL